MEEKMNTSKVTYKRVLEKVTCKGVLSTRLIYINTYLRNTDLVYRVEEEINTSKETCQTDLSKHTTYINTYLGNADLVYRV